MSLLDEIRDRATQPTVEPRIDVLQSQAQNKDNTINTDVAQQPISELEFPIVPGIDQA